MKLSELRKERKLEHRDVGVFMVRFGRAEVYSSLARLLIYMSKPGSSLNRALSGLPKNGTFCPGWAWTLYH